ncbi:MAG: hypothetical protein ABI054_07685, partial [Planctomycetota bacterium]
GDDPKALLDFLIATLDVLHYTLPKTTDAPVISQKLRAALAESRMAFKDKTSGLKVSTKPADLEPVVIAEADLPVIARWSEKDGGASVTIKRWTFKERRRKDALSELDAQLAELGIKEVEKDRSHVLDTRAEVRRWSEPRGESHVERETLFFNGKGYLFSLEYEFPAGWKGVDNHEDELDRFRWGIEQEGVSTPNPHMVFQNRASWSGELKYNLWFSIGSTLLFVVLTLLLAWWKLSRIDF